MGVQVLERDLPAHEFEKKRAKLNGKRKKDYLRVPVPTQPLLSSHAATAGRISVWTHNTQ